MSRVFRVFLSSTFKDWTEEREHLRSKVFPKLAEWIEMTAEDLGVKARFLPVDLRWGISEEAGNTHATVEICLDEIRRCQQVSPRPNFLVFLGQRYGWRPVPPTISMDHWSKLEDLGVINAGDLFHECYQPDENAFPHEYVLRPKSKVEDWDSNEKKLRLLLDESFSADRAAWEKAFNRDELAFLIGSVTEQEIVRGALAPEQAKNHVHLFMREMASPPADDEEKNNEINKKISDERLGSLKQHLKDTFPNDQIRTYEPGNSTDKHYLDQFGKDVASALMGTIQAELERIRAGHADQDLAPDTSDFVGRNELDEVLKWDAKSPLMLFGEAGTGKSTLLSRAAADMQDAGSKISAYWIGRDNRCATGTGLLRVMLGELNPNRFDANVLASMNYPELAKEARKALHEHRDSVRIIIDAVDQLPENDSARSLRWLPESAPVLLSTLDGKQKETFERLPEGTVVELGALPEGESGKLLDAWLANAGRKLTEGQRSALLTEHNGKPLHLRILFERARYLRSFDGVPAWLNGKNQPTENAITDLYNWLSREEEHGTVIVSHALAYLASTSFGMPEDVLLALLRQDDEVVDSFRSRSPNSPDVGPDRLPEIVWSRLYHDLEAFLARREFFSEQYLDFYHAQFRRVLAENSWSAATLYCRLVMDKAAREWKKEDATGSISLRNFLFRHATDNAIELGEGALFEAVGRLMNPDYLKMRMNALPKEMTLLLEEYPRLLHVLQDSALHRELKGYNIWADFIQSQAALLLRANEDELAFDALAQLAWEHGKDSPVSADMDQWLETSMVRPSWIRRQQRPARFLRPLKIAERSCGFTIRDAKIDAESGRVVVRGRDASECCFFQWRHEALISASSDSPNAGLPHQDEEPAGSDTRTVFQRLKAASEARDSLYKLHDLEPGNGLKLYWQTEDPDGEENAPWYEHRSWLRVETPEGSEVPLKHPHAGILHVRKIDDRHVLSWGSESDSLAIWNVDAEEISQWVTTDDQQPIPEEDGLSGELIELLENSEINPKGAFTLDGGQQLVWGFRGLCVIDSQSGAIEKIVRQVSGRDAELDGEVYWIHQAFMDEEKRLWFSTLENRSTPGEDIYVSITYTWDDLNKEPGYIGEGIGLPYCRRKEGFVFMHRNPWGFEIKLRDADGKLSDSGPWRYFGENIEPVRTLGIPGDEGRLLIREGGAIHELERWIDD